MDKILQLKENGRMGLTKKKFFFNNMLLIGDAPWP